MNCKEHITKEIDDNIYRSICHGLSEILQGYLMLVLYKSVLQQHYKLNLNFIFIALV
jgi:hypothetical protein